MVAWGFSSRLSTDFEMLFATADCRNLAKGGVTKHVPAPALIKLGTVRETARLAEYKAKTAALLLVCEFATTAHLAKA